MRILSAASSMKSIRPSQSNAALWYYFNKREPEKILPPPTVENMYFFKGKTGDLDNMQSLLNSDKQGYIICPVWTEDVTGVLDDPDENPSIRGSGTIEFFIKEAPLSMRSQHYALGRRRHRIQGNRFHPIRL